VGLGAQEGEVTVCSIPHGPGLLRETSAASELHPNAAQRALGSLLQVLCCCCRCCREVVRWQFVTRACRPAASVCCLLCVLKVCQLRCRDPLASHSHSLSSSAGCCSTVSPEGVHHNHNSRSAGVQVAASWLFGGLHQGCCCWRWVCVPCYFGTSLGQMAEGGWVGWVTAMASGTTAYREGSDLAGMQSGE
jgi:hypothetical protein